MNLNHDAPDIPTAFKLTKKRASGIDTFTRLSFQAGSDRKVSEVFSGAIKTGVVKNQNEIAFMGICVGVMLELRIQQVLKEKALREAQKAAPQQTMETVMLDKTGKPLPKKASTTTTAT